MQQFSSASDSLRTMVNRPFCSFWTNTRIVARLEGSSGSPCSC